MRYWIKQNWLGLLMCIMHLLLLIGGILIGAIILQKMVTREYEEWLKKLIRKVFVLEYIL